MPGTGDGFAEQRRNGHVVHAAERPQPEGKRGEQAIDKGQQKLVEMQRRHHGQRQDLAEQPDDHKGQCGAGCEPDHRAERGEHDHLRGVDREDIAAGGADSLEGRDDVAAAIDVALHGVRHADAADQERGEANQRQELGEAADGAFKLRRGIGAAADFPAGFRRGRAGIRDEGRRGTIVGGVVRQFDAVDPAHEAARQQQAGGAQARFTDEEARTEPDIAGKLVRLGGDHAAQLEGRIADRDAIAELEVEPRQQRRIDRSTERAVTLGKQLRDRQFRRECQFAEHWIGGIDRLQFDQREPAVGGTRHRAQGGRDRDASARAQEGDLFGLGFALDHRKRDVAAKQRAALAGQSIAEARRHRTDTGDRHHAERDTGDEDVEAAQAAAQFTQGVAKRQ